MKIKSHLPTVVQFSLRKVFCLLCILTSFQVIAEDIDFLSLSLAELRTVKIATGTSINIQQAPAMASLISADDIRAMGASTIDEVLESIPGLHVIPSTLNRTLPSYTFRGIYSGQNPQVLFMLNGYVMYSSLYNGGVQFISEMNVNNISHIEVVRGPGSAIYGADAYSGVVNFVTKTAAQYGGLNLGIRGGTHNTKNAWLQYGGKLDGEWDINLYIESYRKNADKTRIAEVDFQATFDAIFGTNASLAPSYIDDRRNTTSYGATISNENWSMGINGHEKRNAGVGAGAAQAIDHYGYDDYRYYIFNLAYQNNNLVNDWNFEGQFSYNYAKSSSSFVLLPPNTVLPVGNDGNVFTEHDGIGCLTANIPTIGCVTTFSDGLIGNPNNRSRVSTIDTIAHYKGWETHQIRVNLGSKNEHLTASETKNFGPGVLDSFTLAGTNNPVVVSGAVTNVTGTDYIYIKDQTRQVNYLSLQDIWKIAPDLTLTSGVRFDHYDDFGSTTNLRLALVWNSTEKLITKLLYGEAFRAPSFSDLYAKNNPVSLGNENLVPEEISTTELSFNYTFSQFFSGQMNLYHYRTRNMIEVVSDAQGVGTAQNNKNLTGKGFEVNASWRPSEVIEVSANYFNQSTKNNIHNKQVEYVPQQQFYFDTRWKISKNWMLSGQLNWISDRERSASDTRDRIEDYKLVNTTLRHLGTHWEIALIVKNLLDSETYEPTDGKIVNDYRMHERRVYLELSYHL